MDYLNVFVTSLYEFENNHLHTENPPIPRKGNQPLLTCSDFRIFTNQILEPDFWKGDEASSNLEADADCAVDKSRCD